MLKKICLFVVTSLLLVACGSKDNVTNLGSGMATPGTHQHFVQELKGGDRVFFALNSTSLDGSSSSVVAAQASWLKKYPSTRVEIQGHADERGTRDYNIALGSKRAQSVKNALIANGVDAGRISIVSFGKERPVKVGNSEESWAVNRRAVSVVR